MDIENIKLFVMVCEAGSMLQVATREHLSAPTLSRKIKQLEAQTGVALLKRGRRGVQPTPEGLLMLEKATALLNMAQELHNLLPSRRSQHSGVVTVMGSFSMTAGQLLDDIHDFLMLEENRNVRVVLKEADKQTIVDGVRAGRAALGVFWDATETSGLQTYPYRHDRGSVIVHPSHPLAKRDTVSYAEVICYATVHTKTMKLVESMLERSGMIESGSQNNRLEVPTFEALLRVVRKGSLVGICPREVAQVYQESFGLKILPLADRWADRRHVIGCLNVAALTPAARSLLEHLQARAPKVT